MAQRREDRRLIMPSYCCILIFVMMTFAHGQDYNDDTVMRINITKDNTKHCGRPNLSSMPKLEEKPLCQPRERLITLKLNNSDRVLSPLQVLAYRCDRDAISPSQNYVCSAIEKETFTITVQASYGPRSKKCLTVQVSNDTKCAHRCSLTPDSCNEDQSFSQENCACTCRNWQTKKQECESRQRSWNRDDCSCNCKNTRQCLSPQTWSEEICDCRRNH